MITPSPGREPAGVPAACGQATAGPGDGAGAAPGPAAGVETRRHPLSTTPEVPGLRGHSLGELRELRRRAQSEESDLSYVRRLLQGRIDILEAERRRRCAQDGPLVEQLTRILADAPARQRSSARHVTIATPVGSQYRQLVEGVLAEVELSDLTARTDAELLDALARLARFETEVSERRQSLQRTADGCSAEITRRYREGEARIDDLLG
nr:ABC transporter substrate-binding protein [Streptomyces sp. SM12]